MGSCAKSCTQVRAVLAAGASTPSVGPDGESVHFERRLQIQSLDEHEVGNIMISASLGGTALPIPMDASSLLDGSL